MAEVVGSIPITPTISRAFQGIRVLDWHASGTQMGVPGEIFVDQEMKPYFDKTELDRTVSG